MLIGTTEHHARKGNYHFAISKMNQQPVDWPRIRFVVFDVDGTLYAQRPLRLRMAARLLLHSVAQFTIKDLAVLHTFRQRRETLGDEEVLNFEEILIEEVASHHGLPHERVRRIAKEWIEDRPLPLLRQCRYPRVDDLFEKLRHSGRKIGILSDYPSHNKLAAMQLDADYVLSAGEVGILKPHPLGLTRLMAEAGVTQDQTLFIGDRAERDGEAADRAGVTCILRSTKPIPGYRTFSRFDDPIFDGVSKFVANA